MFFKLEINGITYILNEIKKNNAEIDFLKKSLYTVTVSPLPTFMIASLSRRTLSLNSLMSLRVIIEAAEIGGNSTFRNQ